MAEHRAAPPPLCPSATGEAQDPHIIGVVGRDGAVVPISTPIRLTPEMREATGPQPERVFRLSAPCTAAGCAQWADGACGLAGRMRGMLGHRAADTLPPCGIRASCVWWRQDGRDACRICHLVTYNPSS